MIVDARLEGDPDAALRRALDDALCLGVTVLTGGPIADAVRASRFAKACRPDLPVVWGGWHPSMFGRECLEEPSVDVTVAAQGEITFAEICDRLVAGESIHDLDGCPGCAYRGADGDVIRIRRARSPTSTASVRTTTACCLSSATTRSKGGGSSTTSPRRGAPSAAPSAPIRSSTSRKWVGLEPERMGEEIGELWQRYRFDDLSFQDETYFTYAAAGRRRWRTRFSAANLPITWAATMRADQGDRLPEEVMAHLPALRAAPRPDRRRVRVAGDDGLDQEGHQSRTGASISAEKMPAPRHRGSSPSSSASRTRSDESVQRLARPRQAAARDVSPDFETPIFYFKPYPGIAAHRRRRARRLYASPRTLDEWARFDFVGSVGPWVSPREVPPHRAVQVLPDLAAGPGRRPAPARLLARWRLPTTPTAGRSKRSSSAAGSARSRSSRDLTYKLSLCGSRSGNSRRASASSHGLS